MKKFSLKVLCLLLAFTFMIPTAYGADFSDIKGTEFEEAVKALNMVGIMIGDESGFRPNDNVKRSEYAAIIVRALGLESIRETLPTAESFNDVPSDHWALGHINVAKSLEIIAGMGDGSFRPDDDVTYEQAIKMTVCALGYNAAAVQNGGYPVGYITVAIHEGITDDIKAEYARPATRGVIAQLIYNALDTPLMVRVFQNQQYAFQKTGTNGSKVQTLLTENLGYEVTDGEIIAIDGGNRTATLRISSSSLSSRTGTYKYKIPEGMDFINLRGFMVTVWVPLNTDTVANIIPSKTSSMIYDYIYKIDGQRVYDNVNQTISLSGIKGFNFASTGDYYEVNEKARFYMDDKEIGGNVLPFIDKFAKCLVQNNEIVAVYLYNLTEGGILTNASEDSISYRLGTIGNQAFSGIGRYKYLTVVIDGKPAAMTSLAAEMIVDYYKGSGDETCVIVASSKKVTGELKSYSDTRVTILTDEESRWYNLSTVFGPYYSDDMGGEFDTDIDMLDDIVNKRVEVYLDDKWEVRYFKNVDAVTAADFYGFVTKAWAEDEEYIRVYNADMSDTMTYELNIKSNTTGLRYNDVKDDPKKNRENYDTIKGLSSLTSYINPSSYSDEQKLRIYKFRVEEDGRISKIENIQNEFSVKGRLGTSRFSNNENARANLLFPTGDPNAENTANSNTGKEFRFDGALFLRLFIDEDGEFAAERITWYTMRDKDGALNTPIWLNPKPSAPKPELCLVFSNNVGVSRDERFALITETTRISSEQYELNTLYQGNSRTFTTSASLAKTLPKRAYAQVYEIQGKNAEVNLIADLSGDMHSWQVKNPGANGLAVAESVYSIKDNNIAFQEQGTSGISYRSLATWDLMVFEVDTERDEFTLRSIADIKKNQRVWYILYYSEVKALFYER